jgi:hypothetical protein
LVSIHIEHICSFFVAFFSATIDGRNLIFGHKLHIGTPYRGKRFWTRQIPIPVCRFCWFLYTFNQKHFPQYGIPIWRLWPNIRFLPSTVTEKNATKNILDGRSQIPIPVCRFCWFLYTFNIHLYMHIFRRIFLSNYWWQESDIRSQASYFLHFFCLMNDFNLESKLWMLKLEHNQRMFYSEFLSYNLMSNSGKKNFALRDKKNKYSNSCVVRIKNFWTKQKTITPCHPSS